MKKRRVEHQFDLIASVMKLEILLAEHIHKDELTGDHVVISLDKLKESWEAVRHNLRMSLDVEMNKKDTSHRPLRELMIKYFEDMNYGAGQINESPPEDNNGETSVGEKSKQVTLRGA